MTSPYQPPIVPGAVQPPPHPPQQHFTPGLVAPAGTAKHGASALSIAFIVVGSLAFLIGIITFAIGSSAASPAAAPSPSPVPVIVYVSVPAPVAQTTTAPATTGPPPAPTIEDGTWTVGVDMPAGKYRATANVGSDCYWAIYKSGTNGGTIISNDIPGGGRPTVTLKAGQDFHTARCGTWAKIG